MTFRPIPVSVALVLLGSTLATAASTPPSDPSSRNSTAPVRGLETCTSTREYIATLEYLRDQKNFSLSEAQSRELAQKVSEGCSQAAGRFIRVSKLLLRAELSGTQVAQSALEVSRLSDESADAFLRVFRRVWSSDQLDLPAAEALKLARTVALANLSPSDFEAIIDFCISPKFLELPRHRCGEIASRVSESAAPFSEKPGSAAKRFIDAFAFAQSTAGPQATAQEALKIAEEVAVLGPEALENFSRAYKYALAPKGLGLNRAESLAFARKMAQSSLRSETGLGADPARN